MPKKNQVKVDVIIDDKGSMKKSAVGAHSVDRRLKGAAKASSGASKNFSKMAQGISGGLVPAYATLAASLFALDAVYRALSGAADLRILQEGQIAFAKSTGQAMNAVAGAVQRATEFQVSFKEASQAAAIAASAGFGTSQIVALGKAANDAAKVLGRSVPDAFDRLVRGVVKAEPEVLDELGIILRLDDAAEKYARQMGLNASELTVFEKQQAVLNDVLDQAERKFAAVAETIDPNPWTQLGVALEKVKDSFAIMISSVLEPIASFLAGNAYAAIAAMGIFVASIMRGLIPSYAESAAKFVETQNAQQVEIDQTIVKLQQLKRLQEGSVEKGAMAMGGAQKLAKGAGAPISGTMGKLARGDVISAKRASQEIKNITANKEKYIATLGRKGTADYIKYMRTIKKETQVSTGVISRYFQTHFVKTQIGIKKMQLRWKGAMMAMQRVTTLASRAMSLAMSAMGWLGIITMIYQGFMAWKESTKEVDEAQERLDKRTQNLEKTYKDLAYTFEEVNKDLDDITEGWTTQEEAIAFYSNTVKNIPIQDTIDLLKDLDGKAVPEKLKENMEKTFDEMAKIVPAMADMNAEMDSTKLLEYVMGFERYALSLQEINSIYKSATESEVKYEKAQKSRIDALIKSDYKKEIRELVNLVEAYAALEEADKVILNDLNLTRGEATKLLKEYSAELTSLLEIRYLELEAQRDSLRLMQEQSYLYKFQKNAIKDNKLEVEKLVQAVKLQNQVDVARKAIQGFGESVKVGEMSGTFGTHDIMGVRAKAGMEWEFAEAEAQLARLEYEQEIHNVRIAYLDALKDEWARMAETVVTSMASGMQKGFEGMLKGDMNLGEAISKMAETMGDAMAKQLSESWTESIMSLDFFETPAQKAAKAAQVKADTARKLMTQKMENLKTVTQSSVDVAKTKVAPAIEQLKKAVEENTNATIDNSLSLGANVAPGVRTKQILKANYPGKTDEEYAAGQMLQYTDVLQGAAMGPFAGMSMAEIDEKMGWKGTPQTLEGKGGLELSRRINEIIKAQTQAEQTGLPKEKFQRLEDEEEADYFWRWMKEKFNATGFQSPIVTGDEATISENIENISILDDINTEDGNLLVNVGNPDKIGDAMSGILSQLPGLLSGSGGMGGIAGTILSYVSKGGYVTKTGVQHFAGGGKVKGKDTVPAMLTPGEYVLTPGQMKSMGQSSTIVNVNMGEGGGGATTSVRSDRAEAAEFGRAIASAVNHEIMKQKRAGGKLWMPGKGIS